MTARLNNGVLVPMSTVVGATISGTYTVGATGSGADVVVLDVLLLPAETRLI